MSPSPGIGGRPACPSAFGDELRPAIEVPTSHIGRNDQGLLLIAVQAGTGDCCSCPWPCRWRSRGPADISSDEPGLVLDGDDAKRGGANARARNPRGKAPRRLDSLDSDLSAASRAAAAVPSLGGHSKGYAGTSKQIEFSTSLVNLTTTSWGPQPSGTPLVDAVTGLDLASTWLRAAE